MFHARPLSSPRVQFQHLHRFAASSMQPAIAFGISSRVRLLIRKYRPLTAFIVSSTR